MKKVFALLMVAGVFALASCGKKEEAAQTETPATEAAAPVATDSAANTAAPTDSAAHTDSSAHSAGH